MMIGMYLRTLYLRYHMMWHMTGQVMAGVWPEATTPPVYNASTGRGRLIGKYEDFAGIG